MDLLILERQMFRDGSDPRMVTYMHAMRTRQTVLARARALARFRESSRFAFLSPGPGARGPAAVDTGHWHTSGAVGVYRRACRTSVSQHSRANVPQESSARPHMAISSRYPATLVLTRNIRI